MRFAKLSEVEQKKVELEYHRMKPDELEGVMSRGTHHSPSTIRLSSRLVKKLKLIAANEGETEYQTMVKKWVEERARLEAGLTRKSTKQIVSAKPRSL